MRVWRDLTARPLRQLTLAEAPLRPLRPPPRQLLVREVIGALAEHLPCAERPPCALHPLRPLPAWQHARNRRGPGRFPRRTRPSRTRPRQSHCRNHPPALPTTQLPAPPTAILSDVCTHSRATLPARGRRGHGRNWPLPEVQFLRRGTDGHPTNARAPCPTRARRSLPPSLFRLPASRHAAGVGEGAGSDASTPGNDERRVDS